MLFLCRGYVHLFGTDAPVKLAEHISSLERQRATLLEALPGALQKHIIARQQEAAETPAALQWVIPAPIFNEEAFRLEHGGESAVA